MGFSFPIDRDRAFVMTIYDAINLPETTWVLERRINSPHIALNTGSGCRAASILLAAALEDAHICEAERYRLMDRKGRSDAAGPQRGPS